MTNGEKIISPWQWAYAAALAALIVWASGRSQVAAPSVTGFDKAAHFAVFGLLGTLAVRPMRGPHAWRAVVIVAVFGGADELRQSLTPGRSMEFADWMADTAGAALAVTAYTAWTWYRRLLETPLWKQKPKVEAGAVSERTMSAL